MLLVQHTAFSYGQQPCLFAENSAPQTVPVTQTCLRTGGAGAGAPPLGKPQKLYVLWFPPLEGTISVIVGVPNSNNKQHER